MNALRSQGLTKQFTGLRALDQVDITLHPREILGLIGPNGSGKTTTVNLMTGFLLPTSGRVVVDGQDVTGKSPHRIARTGVRRTFQTIRLFKAFTVLENVEVAGVSSGMRRLVARERAREILANLGLESLQHVSAGALPYGEERRVEIARALVARPRYLLLDEPAAGMNERESDALLEALPAVVREYDCGMLIIDHDMRLIMRLCQRLHVLNHGSTVAEGTPAEIRRNPAVISAYLGTTEADQ
jgi:branched-chain amino acid transport system ATP-binding protein